MTAAFSATWQVFRLGLHPSFKGRAAYSILSNAFAVSKQSPSRFNGRLELFQGAPQHLKPWGFSHPLRTILPNSNRLQGQSRCVNLWMPPPKDEVPGKMTAKKELSLSSADIEKVFGRKMDTEKGAEILMTLQRHRGEGTLDQKIPYSKALISKGLAYLRSVDPINEDAAIIARIDRETDTSPQAVSQFDKLRREIKRRRELQEGIREAEEKRKSEQAGRATSKEIAKKGTTNQSNELVELRKEPEWVRKYREEATNHDEELVKKLSVWSRLLPSAAITFTVVSLSFLFAQSYTPPSRDARLFPNIPPAAATLMALIGINCIVFLMWGIPPLWQFTNRNFLIAPVYPHCMSMIGGAFSHQQFTHLFVNSFMIWLVGTKVHDDIGRGPFLALYFSSAVIGAYVPMLIYVLRNNLVATTLGASCVGTALLATLFVLHEGTTVTFPVLPDSWTRGIDTGVLLAMFMLAEIYTIRRYGISPPMGKLAETARPHSDNMGHLTGYAVGIGAASIIRSRDPKWRDTKRHHWYTGKFNRFQKQPAPDLPSPE